MNMHGPIGYPPPTLVRKRSGSRLRWVILLMALVAIGLFAFSQFMGKSPPPAPVEEPVAPPVAAPEPAPVEAVAPAEPAMTVENLETAAAPAQAAVDARQPNHWHYVPKLGDGPGVIYSRNGNGWDYAFACTPQTKVIEFIAIGTGSPGEFDKQSMTVGATKLMMDAYYAPSGGGTIGMKLPAADPFFSALDGTSPLEIQLYQSRKTIVSVGPDVLRLVRACRGQS